eukprot:14958496-Alexandrium_andersonii.AAC.1
MPSLTRLRSQPHRRAERSSQKPGIRPKVGDLPISAPSPGGTARSAAHPGLGSAVGGFQLS